VPSFALGHTPVTIARPRTAAASGSEASLFAAKSALKRAITVRDQATLQVDQLRALVDRLEAERRAGP
jgi:hypothetical protein